MRSEGRVSGSPRCARWLLPVALVLIAASGCKKEPAETTFPASWRNPEFSGEPFNKIFVIGIGRNDEYRRLYEDSMARALQSEGVGAQASWTLFPETGKLDRARVLIAVEEREFDAVVIARLRRVDETVEFVPAAPMTSSDLYMSGYDAKYAVNSSPAHYKKNKVYRVETTLYSTRDQMVAWVVLSDTLNPKTAKDIIDSVSARVVKQMKAEGLLPTQ